MVARDEGKLVLWPLYFDKAEPRPWRRVPRSIAVENPTADAIAQVAAQMRLKPILERDVPHPKRWWLSEGRVLVDAVGSKSALLVQIAEALHKLPPPKPAGKK